MRMALIAAVFIIGAATVANGQSTGPVLSAYDSLPIASEAPASPPAPEPQRQPPPATTVAGVTDALGEPASGRIELSNYEVECGDVDCGDGVLEPLGADSFWFGSLELTMFTPSIPGPASDLTPDGFVAPRGTIGWESSRHLGVRGRFWGANGDAYQSFGGGGPIDLDVQPTRFDFDVYRRFLFDDSSLLVGGGVTAAEMEFDLGDYASFRDRGAGVQFFAEGRHRLTCSSVAETTLFARGRWAALTGEWESPSGWSEGNSHIDILEAAFGVEWRRQFKTADLILQVSMESQSWDATYTGNVDFIGSVFSIGFAR